MGKQDVTESNSIARGAKGRPKKPARFAIIALFLTASAPAAAAAPAIEKRYTRDYAICMDSEDAANGIQSAMNACAYDEYTRQDGRLNQAYVMVMRRQAMASKAKLRGLQRAWIRQRDVKCEAERMTYDRGSMAPLVFHTCMTNQAINRTLWLERYR